MPMDMMQYPSTPRSYGRRRSNPLEDTRDTKRFRSHEGVPGEVHSSIVNETGPVNALTTPQRKHQAPTDFHDRFSSKRVKIGHHMDYSPRETTGNVGAQELASALALASLASPHVSPMSSRDAPDAYPEQRSHLADTYHEDVRTPRVGATPVTPEGQHHMAEAMASMASYRRRMVRPGRAQVPVLSPFHPALQMQTQEPLIWAPMQAAMAGPPMLPPMLPPPSQALSNPRGWFCDFCNTRSFSTYEEAAAHEATCSARGASRDDDQYSVVVASKDSPREEVAFADDETVLATNVRQQQWGKGCVPLRAGPSDDDWLSEVNSYLRKHCVEVFSATNADICHTSKRGRTAQDQVGLRCVFCKGTHPSNPPAAVSYPTTMAGIYESVKRWQRIHLPSCPHVPEEVHHMIEHLQSKSTWVPTTRQYWIDSARSLGIVDTPQGIRFQRTPGMTPGWKPDLQTFISQEIENTRPVDDSRPSKSESGGHITFPDDQDGVPPYVYFLMRQVESCNFTDADRFVARSKCQVGYPGFQCRHCEGHAGLGKYFPLNPRSLSTNSTSQNIHAHMLKCRKCPQAVKQRLLDLKEAKTYAPRLMAGWRRAYFDRLWERIHG